MMRLKGDFLDAGVNMSLDDNNHVETVVLMSRIEKQCAIKGDDNRWFC